MSTWNGDCFDGSSKLLDIHDLPVVAGKATWFNKFSPVIQGPQERIAEALLWLFYNLGLCGVIVGEFAMYIEGVIADHPGIINVYIAYHPQKLCLEISALLQNSSTPAFSFDKLDFLYMPTYSRPAVMCFILSGLVKKITSLRRAIVNYVKTWGSRSSINFTY